jgi:hypothetical protein
VPLFEVATGRYTVSKASVLTAPTRERCVAKRLPRPSQPVRIRCELDDSELRALELVAAGGVRLSVASFARVALIEATEAGGDPERVKRWAEIAAALAAGTGDTPPVRPGRPKTKKDDEGEPKKGKK